jgi:hypothetical protein
MLPAAERLPEAPLLVERGMYFVVHAPRQTGKTTTLTALARQLTAAGKYAALLFSCEAGEVPADDYVEAQRAVLAAIRLSAHAALPVELQPPARWPEESESQLLATGLSAWAQACPRPLVLFFDEIDALRGKGLQTVLRQLRAGYSMRPFHAPWSVALCGLRDVREYKAASGGDPERLGTSSPFNIKVESLRLREFTAAQIATLYAQHTAETGQPFTVDAVARVFTLTGGQPWLVNSIAREITDKMHVAPPEPITAEHVERAKERLILARATHLDSLVARLGEDRVRRVIEPLLAGTFEGDETYDDDFLYVRDLGLVAPDAPTRPANPIYREVMVRTLAAGIERRVVHEGSQFVRPDGRLDMDRLLQAFAEFWRENGDVLAGQLAYHEVAPQLVLMAFLQRVVNGGGFIDREYGVGRRRIDLLIRWPYEDEHGQRQWQREALELKVWRDKRPDPLDEGLRQLDEYLARLDLDHGVLVIFDRRNRRQGSSSDDAPPIQTAFEPARTAHDRAVTVLRA